MTGPVRTSVSTVSIRETKYHRSSWSGPAANAVRKLTILELAFGRDAPLDNTN